MHRNRFFITLATFVLGAVLATPLCAAPNFAGVWKFVAEKSDYGPMPVPGKMEQTIAQDGPDLKVSFSQSSEQGDIKGELTFNTEGKETTNEIRGTAMKSKAKYDGGVLVIESKIDFQGNEVTFNEKWVLTEEGKTLTISRKINTPQGELEQKIVLAKQ